VVRRFFFSIATIARAARVARATGGWMSSRASNSNGQQREAECGLLRHPVLQCPRARRMRGNDAGWAGRQQLA
jgi:hypothetical protein